MANRDLISRMRTTLVGYRAGRSSIHRAEQVLEALIESIEGIGLSSIHQLRHPTSRLVIADLSIGEELIDTEGVAEVLSDLRRYFHSSRGG